MAVQLLQSNLKAHGTSQGIKKPENQAENKKIIEKIEHKWYLMQISISL